MQQAREAPMRLLVQQALGAPMRLLVQQVHEAQTPRRHQAQHAHVGPMRLRLLQVRLVRRARMQALVLTRNEFQAPSRMSDWLEFLKLHNGSRLHTPGHGRILAWVIHTRRLGTAASQLLIQWHSHNVLRDPRIFELSTCRMRACAPQHRAWLRLRSARTPPNTSTTSTATTAARPLHT